MRVLVPPPSSSTRAYHTEECQYVGDRHRDWDRQTALEWGYEKCSRCVEIEKQESALPEVEG